MAMEIAHLIDMDGVLVRGGLPIEGSIDFVRALVEDSRAFQVFDGGGVPGTTARRRYAVCV